MASSRHPETPYVFISYASADRERVLEIVDLLEKAGIVCWVDRHDIRGGANWGLRISEAIEHCAGLVLMSSAAAFSSRNVRQEVAVAWNFDKPYLPLLLDRTPIPSAFTYWLVSSQWIELLDKPTDEWLPEVRAAIQEWTKAPTSTTPEPASSATTALTTPARSLGTSLPSLPSSFIGREREMAESAALLANNRIVTLTGPGGIGKTRLAIALAHRLSAGFPDGVVFVDLSPLRDPSLVLPAIGTALGVHQNGGTPLGDTLAAVLGARKVLLVVDNVEQVVAGVDQIAALVRACPALSVLATSREPLRLTGEAIYPVEPLPLPEPTSTRGLTALRGNPTVALFVARARAARPSFELTDENEETIVAICRRLEGLPLAIELAGARMRTLSPQTLLEQLSDPLRFLTGGARDLPSRQRTLRDTIAWSIDLLSPEAQRLFRRLSVFVGGWTLEAGTAVAGSDGIDVLGVLDELIDHSLVSMQEQPDGTCRYTMLETIREFGFEWLKTRGEALEIQLGHARYFADLAEQARPHLTGEGQQRWMARLTAEYGNLQTALSWSMATDVTITVQLVFSLWRLWYMRGLYTEARTWIAAVLKASTPSSGWGDAALDVLWREVFYADAVIALAEDDVEHARERYEQCLELYCSASDRGGMARALNGLGSVASAAGQVQEARQYLEQSLTIFRELGDVRAQAVAIYNLGLQSFGQGDSARATELLSEAHALWGQASDESGLATSAMDLGGIALEMGDYLRAALWLREALERNHELNLLHNVAGLYQMLASLAWARGDPGRAARLFGAAATLFERIGYTPAASQRAQYERHLPAVRDQLGEQTWQAEWDTGRQLSNADAYASALAVTEN